ncbi:MAG: transposase [Bacteroidales bacterium]|nr:transposase [Bacteroidales bacterium]
MNFPEPGLYHIYNRGNNKEPIFFGDGDYIHFISLCKKHITNRCQILAWCLMPNHFHFMVNVNDVSLELVKWGGNVMPSISNGFQLLQSNYTKRINYRENRTGSLFQQKTKSKLLETKSYALTAFWYLHQNPVKAALAKNMLEWEYSSYKEYCGLRSESLSKIELGKAVLNLLDNDFSTESLIHLDEDEIEKIF